MADYTIKNSTHLTFSHDFNEQIDQNYIPTNMTNLTFGSLFNQQFLLAKTISFVL